MLCFFVLFSLSSCSALQPCSYLDTFFLKQTIYFIYISSFFALHRCRCMCEARSRSCTSETSWTVLTLCAQSCCSRLPSEYTILITLTLLHFCFLLDYSSYVRFLDTYSQHVVSFSSPIPTRYLFLNTYSPHVVSEVGIIYCDLVALILSLQVIVFIDLIRSPFRSPSKQVFPVCTVSSSRILPLTSFPSRKSLLASPTT